MGSEVLASYPKGSDYTVQSGAMYKGALDNALKHFTRVANSFAPFANIVFDFAPGDVSAANDSITETHHGLLLNDVVQFTTTGTLPAGLSLATNYHVISGGLTDSVFTVSASQGGAVIDITDQGSGIHTATLTTGLTMRLGRGFLIVNDAIPTEVTVQQTSTLSAPSANPRKDLVVVDDSTGTMTIVTGAENASPVDPTVTADTLVIARINWVVSQTTIENSDINDLRTTQMFPTSTVASLQSDIDATKTNIALLGFLRSTDHATSVLNMQNGFIDQFEDQTGVDDVNSTNELYDASGDEYGPNGAVNMTLISEPQVALTAPDSAHVALFNEEVDTLTINTDIMAWASRSKQTVTATNATNVLNATAHGLSNGDRVMMTSSGSGATVPSVAFDFTNDGLSATQSVLGVSDTKVLTLSFWFNPLGHDSSYSTIITGTVDGKFTIRLNADSTMYVAFKNAAGTPIGVFKTTSTFTASGGLYHFVMSVNMATTTAVVYVNDVRETLSYYTALVDDIIDVNDGTSIIIGDVGINGDGFDGEMSQFYYAEEFVDLTDTAKRRKFITSSGLPTNMGADGSRPTGTQPLIFLNNTTATWQNNLGSGGNFTEAGALTDGTDLTEGSSLPGYFDSETVYHVVNKTVNTFKVSLTSGGAAVTFSDDGTGTHSVLAVSQCTLVDQGDFDTGKATLSGTVDISGQPSGTDMTLIVQTKNLKDTKLHGQALQYA